MESRVKDEAQLTAFNQFLKDCAIASVADLTAVQKQYAYQSFKLSQIMVEPQLFESEPEIKIGALELADGELTLTISLTAGVEAIELAKDRLAKKIRVGTSLESIDNPPSIVSSPSADGKTLTFTIVQPSGSQGFVKVRID